MGTSNYALDEGPDPPRGRGNFRVGKGSSHSKYREDRVSDEKMAGSIEMALAGSIEMALAGLIEMAFGVWIRGDPRMWARIPHHKNQFWWHLLPIE